MNVVFLLSLVKNPIIKPEPMVILFTGVPEIVKLALLPGTTGSGKMVTLSSGGLFRRHLLKVVALL